MNNKIYPLILIGLAICAGEAAASPRIQGLTRCSLNGARWSGVEQTRPAAAPAVEQDDLCLSYDEEAEAASYASMTAAVVEAIEAAPCAAPEEAVVEAPAAPAPALVMVDAAPRQSSAALPRLSRALGAIATALEVPIRLGIAIFGTSEAPPPPVKPRVRTLTLF